MKTLIKAIAIITFTLFTANAAAKSINSNEVESSYIKCEMNENGKLVPNYFVVVKGNSYQTDAKTFHLIQKSKGLDVTIALNIDFNEGTVLIEKSAVAEK